MRVKSTLTPGVALIQRKGTAMTLCLAAFIAACSPPASLSSAQRILCGFADVLVEQTELEIARQAFGDDDDLGSRICRAAAILLTGDGEQEPSPIIAVTNVDLPLPDGESIPVQIAPPTR